MGKREIIFFKCNQLDSRKSSKKKIKQQLWELLCHPGWLWDE